MTEIKFPPLSGPDSDGIRAYHDACLHAWLNDFSPESTAEIVAELATAHPFLWDEVYALRAMGDRWRNAQGLALGEHALPEPPPMEPPPATEAVQLGFDT